MLARPPQNAFTIIETLVVICIVGVLTLVIFPNYIQRKEHTTASQLAGNIRKFATTFTDYAKQKEDLPDKPTASIPPDHILEEIPRFREESIIGGYWEWSCNCEINQIEIRLVDHEGTIPLIERVDQLLDDGNLSTGAMTGDEDHLKMILQR